MRWRFSTQKVPSSNRPRIIVRLFVTCDVWEHGHPPKSATKRAPDLKTKMGTRKRDKGQWPC